MNYSFSTICEIDHHWKEVTQKNDSLIRFSSSHGLTDWFSYNSSLGVKKSE